MKIKRGILSLALVFMLQPIPAPASGQLPDALYLQQQSSNSCTLCSATMMIRSCLNNHHSQNWEAVTEQVVAESAWTEAGLSWQWSWTDGNNSISVAHLSCNGLSEQELKDLLSEHPEGIVLYCGGPTHHGVLLVEYRDSVFYCADPAVGYAGKLIELGDSLLGDRLGSQDDILQNVTAYWYIEEYESSEGFCTTDTQTDLKM